jgi:hypothetical protein
MARLETFYTYSIYLKVRGEILAFVDLAPKDNIL